MLLTLVRGSLGALKVVGSSFAFGVFDMLPSFGSSGGSPRPLTQSGSGETIIVNLTNRPRKLLKQAAWKIKTGKGILRSLASAACFSRPSEHGRKKHEAYLDKLRFSAKLRRHVSEWDMEVSL